jgi:hypothetical protein
MRNTTSTKITTRDKRQLQVEFHEALVSFFTFDAWAKGGGYTADGLRAATRKAIRARHHEAQIAHPLLKANNQHPDIYTLVVDATKSASAVYTVEHGLAVVRGFCLACDAKVPGEEAIQFICEPGWFPGPFPQEDTEPSAFELTWQTRE